MSDLAASRQTPPRPDELELSLFGSGIGESLAVHLGNGEWAIVDSGLIYVLGKIWRIGVPSLSLIGRPMGASSS
jgi:hypothetical protein